MNSGRTALHYAVGMKRTEIVRHLLYKLHAFPSAAAFDNSTPLHAAVETRQPEMAEMLMDKDADPTIQMWQSEEGGRGGGGGDGGVSCFDMPEIDENMREIVNGKFPTLYEGDLISCLKMYDDDDKVLYLGVGAQQSLRSFLRARAPSDEFLLTDAWTNFATTLLPNQINPIGSLDLLLSGEYTLMPEPASARD